MQFTWMPIHGLMYLPIYRDRTQISQIYSQKLRFNIIKYKLILINTNDCSADIEEN